MLGRTRETHDVLDEMRRSKRYVSPYHIAIIHEHSSGWVRPTKTEVRGCCISR